MAKESIGIGTVANDGTGDPFRTAMSKCNANFDELYAWVGGDVHTYTSNAVASLQDAGSVAAMNVATANTFTIPPDVFPIKSRMYIIQIGVGKTNLVAGSGVTLNVGANGLGGLYSPGQYSACRLYQRSANVWDVIGWVDQYKVASGSSASAAGASAVAVGASANASGSNAIAIGLSSAASFTRAIALGVSVVADAVRAIALGSVANVNGVSRIAKTAGSDVATAQLYEQCVRTTTTDNTPTALTVDAATAATSNQCSLANNTAQAISGEVIARSSAGDCAMWTYTALIKRGANAAATALVGSPSVTQVYADAGIASATVGLSADTINGSLTITGTGIAATTISWSASVRSVLRA